MSRSRFRIEAPSKEQRKELKFARKDDKSGESFFFSSKGDFIVVRSEEFSNKSGILELDSFFIEVEYGKSPESYGFKTKEEKEKEKPLPATPSFEDPVDNEIAKNIAIARKKGLDAPHRMKRVNESAADSEGRMTLLGMSLCSVIRKLGSVGFGPEQVMAICIAHNLNPATNTVKIQIGKGRRGVGPMAQLSDEQIIELMNSSRSRQK